MLHYLTLLGFILCFASLYTLAAYCITSNPWTFIFLTATGAMIFVLENIELNRIVRDQEKELEIRKQSAQITLIPKINDIDSKINQLHALVSESSPSSEERKHSLKKLRKSNSSNSI